MSNAAKHKFTSAKADGADATLVRPSNWNDEHVFAGGQPRMSLIRDSGQSDGANWAQRAEVLSSQFTPVGNVGAGEDDLMSYTLPANTLYADAQVLKIEVYGTAAANGNTKTLRFKFGATTAVLNPSTTAPNGIAWKAVITIMRKSATTQDMYVDGSIDAFNTLVTPAETLSGAIVIKCTGQATANDDLQQRGMIVQAL